MILFGGTILTMDSNQPEVEALALRDGRVVVAGSLKQARAAFPQGSVEIDLRGRTAIPGFNDDHIHLIGMADYFSRPSLAGLNETQIVERLKEMYKDARPGELLVGNGWDYPACTDPHRSVLDAAFPENPVVLYQYSGHGAWANSRLLRQAGITRSTKDPVGGRIVRDSSGEPTGILLDAATRPIRRIRNRIQDGDHERRERLFERALAMLAENGLTSVQDNTWFPENALLYLRFMREGRLTARISCWSDGRTRLNRFRLERLPFDGTLLTLGPVKYFLDGTFSTKTAWMIDPYPGEPDNFGIPMGKGKWAHDIVRREAARHRQPAFHAIGDRAVHELTDAVEAAVDRYSWTRDLRVRIEHGQIISDSDMRRIRDLGMVVSAQPHALGKPAKDARILGEERARRAYPYRSLIAAGVPLAFGSDVPGESTFAPLHAIHETVNRDSPESIGVMDALRAYTVGSAFAQGMENEKGTLTVGKLADIVVLSENPLNVDPKEIREIAVEMTILGGKVVFDRQGSNGKRSAASMAQRPAT